MASRHDIVTRPPAEVSPLISVRKFIFNVNRTFNQGETIMNTKDFVWDTSGKETNWEIGMKPVERM